MAARAVEDHLNSDQAMARLAAHAGHLRKLQRIFETSAPAMLRTSCRVANFKAGVVVVHAENGAVAAKLRQIAPSLGEVFIARGEQVTEIRIKVQPLDVAVQQEHKPSAAVIGESARASIGRLCAALPEGPLRAALEQLATRSGSK